VLRSLLPSNPTLPIGLQHVNLTSDLPRTTTNTISPTTRKTSVDHNIPNDASINPTTCSHCGRYCHLSTNCHHNPASNSYNHNYRSQRYEFPSMNRRSQSPKTSRQFSSTTNNNSHSRSPSPHSSRSYSPFQRSVQPQKSFSDTRYRYNSEEYHHPTPRFEQISR